MGRGLPSDACLAMVNAGGSLYIVSHSSISRFSLRDSSFTNYLRPTLADDFNLLETKPVATRGGRLLFGTTQGVLDLGPDDLRKSPYRPPLTIDGPDRITLGSDERSLTINFAALDFNKAMPITYAYRLDGDGGGGPWAYTTEPRVTLQDIAAGTHRLRIRWTNGDGVWMPGERVVDITRRPTWHERPLAWLIYGLLLALLAVGAWRVVAYIRRLQREIKDIRLSSNERLEVMGQRLRELLSIRETPERVEIGSAGESPERAADEAERHFAAQARAYMEANVGNADFSINDFAREMCVSRTVLFARMKSIFGTTPGNYLLNLRMSEAKRLLLEPGAGVADVAYRVGFSDPKYFGRCFKKIVGCAPSEYHG